jgi:hypothetical protein
VLVGNDESCQEHSETKQGRKFWARHLNIFIRCYLRERISERDEILLSVGCVSKVETSNKFVVLLHP